MSDGRLLYGPKSQHKNLSVSNTFSLELPLQHTLHLQHNYSFCFLAAFCQTTFFSIRLRICLAAVVYVLSRIFACCEMSDVDCFAFVCLFVYSF